MTKLEYKENENKEIKLPTPFQKETIEILINKDENKSLIRETSPKETIEILINNDENKSSIIETSPEDIYKILNRTKNKKIMKLFKKENISKKIINYMRGDKKRKRRKKCEITKNTTEIIEKKKLGRKRKNDNSPSEHTKYDADNIIISIKRQLLRNLVDFFNSYLEKNKLPYRLSYLSGKYGKNINKKDNIKFLKKSIKEILSLKIKTSKSKDIPEDINKKLITDIEKYDIPEINYILGLTFSDWIDIYTKKKNMIVNGNFIECDGFENMILEIKEEDENYKSDYIYCMYNYEKWFYINRPKTKNE